jgi:hypothetical protein
VIGSHTSESSYRSYTVATSGVNRLAGQICHNRLFRKKFLQNFLHMISTEVSSLAAQNTAIGDAVIAEILEVRRGNRRLAPAPSLASGRYTGSGQLEDRGRRRDRGGRRRDVRNCGRAGRQRVGRLRVGGSVVLRRHGPGRTLSCVGCER